MSCIIKNQNQEYLVIKKILNDKYPSIYNIEYIYKIDFSANYKNIKQNKTLIKCLSWEFINQDLFKKFAENYFHKMKKYNIIDYKTKNLIHHHIILKCNEQERKEIKKI